jgi:regulator of sigma E protease
MSSATSSSPSWCGVRVETFAIGFGKRLVGFRRGGTDYQINALPLGGYVKMAGEIPGEETSNDPGELNNHPRWQRMLIAVAGPVANFILAFGLMTGAYMLHNEVNEYISGPAVTDYISPGAPSPRPASTPATPSSTSTTVENPTWDDILNHTADEPQPDRPVLLRSRRPAHRHHFFSSPSKDSPDKFSLDRSGFVPKMQTRPMKVSERHRRRPLRPRRLKPGDQIVSIDGSPSTPSPRCSPTCRTRRASPPCSTCCATARA